MPKTDSYAPGRFCWFELSTPDQNAAKAFYEPLFGWTHQDFPMGPDQAYTMFEKDGLNLGAAYTMGEQEKAFGVPPHWNLYIAVESADATAEKAKQLGGKLLVPPFDVMTVGRMAVVQDPAGAVFCIWQARDHHGASIIDEIGTFCWADLSTPNAEAAESFYGPLFGWTFEVGENDPSGYVHIKSGDKFIGGMPPAAHQSPGVPPHWLIYFYAKDCKASTEQAVGLGGKAYVPATEMPGVGTFSVIADPQGAVFAIYQSAH